MICEFIRQNYAVNKEYAKIKYVEGLRMFEILQIEACAKAELEIHFKFKNQIPKVLGVKRTISQTSNPCSNKL